MKPLLRLPFISISCKHLSRIIVLIFFTCHFSTSASSQCGAGYTRDTINWDYLDFLHQSGMTYGGSYSGTSFMTAAMAQTQYFSVSGNRITYVNTNSCPIGQNGQFYADITTHTGETSTFGVGEDVKFMPAALTNYSMTFSFQDTVHDVRFSVHDIDRLQRITVTAVEGVVAKNITMATLAGSILTITGSGSTSANVKSTNVSVATNVTTGTVNVTISGGVTAFTISVSETTIVSSGSASSQDDGGFYLSDISACFQNPSFPTNYYSAYTQPFTNQPAYFLSNPQSLSVYMVAATAGTGVPVGTADWIFTDPGLDGQKMNSFAYDPVNHWLYYVMDNYNVPYVVQPPSNRKLKKYDFTTGTISTVIADLRTYGIPSFIQGVEFAGAAFYNGSLYLGIEGSDGIGYSTGAESIVWKIDFDGSGNPTTYSQVFGVPGDNAGGAPNHDWGDFVIKDGILISHATGNASGNNHYYHYNLQTGTATRYTGDATTAGQLAQIHDGSIYRVKNNVALYNNSGGVGASTAITVTSCSPAWVSNAGDASDPFKPMCDFGDAPVSYDPVALTVAANQKACNNSTLRIGSAWGDEWSKNTSTTDASGDDEEDGIGTVSVMVSDGVAYNHVQDVIVLNNTGADAYLAGWLDYDADGVFEASEGVVVTVTSSALPQTINLGWTGITVAVGTPNSFLRVRLSSSALTTSNATGWFSDGETEDYPVISQALPLDIRLLDFNATLTRDKNVSLTWKATADQEAAGFQVERSKDQNTWENIGWVDINRSAMTADYSLMDQQATQGKTYYRLKLVERSGSSRYSNTRIIHIDQLITNLNLYPNPAKNEVTLSINSESFQPATLTVRSFAGQVVIKKTVSLNKGDNRLAVSMQGLNNGLYIVELSAGEKRYVNRLTVAH